MVHGCRLLYSLTQERAQLHLPGEDLSCQGPMDPNGKDSTEVGAAITFNNGLCPEVVLGHTGGHQKLATCLFQRTIATPSVLSLY